MVLGGLGALLGGSWEGLGRSCGDLKTTLGGVKFLIVFLIVFFQFFMDFWRILGGFREEFGTIFRRFFAFASKAPIFKIRAPTQCFVRVELLKIKKNPTKNP